MKTTHQALSDFEINYPHPLELKPGDVVTIGERDSTWTEWLWVSVSGKNGGAWMHESMLETPTEPKSKVLEAYSSREISVKKNDAVHSLRSLGGWHWCEKTDGTLGWIPDYVLEQVS